MQDFATKKIAVYFFDLIFALFTMLYKQVIGGVAW